MKEKRDKMQIIYDILRSIVDKRGRIKPTHLLYKSNLSHGRLMHYLEELLAKGFIAKDFDENARYYTITDQGHMFLAEYKKMREFAESFGL